MIRAWRYPDGRDPPEVLTDDDLAAVIDPSRGLVWVDCVDPDDTEVATVVERLGIHELAAEDLRRGRQRTKLDHYRDHYHVALHDCALVGHRLAAREIDVVFSDGWLLSVRRPSDSDPADPEFPLDDVAHRFDLQRGQIGAADEGTLLWAFVDVVVDRYFDVTDAVDDRLDAIEEVVFGENVREMTPQEIFDLRRALGTFRRSASPLREVLLEIRRREVACIADEAIVLLGDVYDHALRVADLVETQRDLLAGLLEAHLAVVAHRTNEVMKKMTAWGAILLGATLIAGIYGMNFRHMPELDWGLGYPAALGSMALLTVVLVTVFKRRGYL